MTYTEDLEKRIEELEAKAEISSEIKRESFYFRRLQYVIQQEFNETKNLPCLKINEDESSSVDHLREMCYIRGRNKGRLIVANNLLRDIEETKEAVLGIEDDQLISSRFNFNLH